MKAINFDLLLVKDLFLNAMEIKEGSLTINIRDLIFVYNSLVEKSDIIMVPGH